MKVTYVQHCGTDLTVVNAARVSFKKERFEMLKDDVGLIKYLAKHGHHSPFNHTWITCHVKAPIFVARQLVKHKFMPWNEVSRRYVDETPEFYEPEMWRARNENKKQGSHDYPVPESDWTSPQSELAAANEKALEAYEEMLALGCCPEQARMVLPQNMYTEWYWSGTLGAWGDMYKLRSKPDAQAETREIARQVDEIIRPLFKVSWPAYVDDAI